MSHLVDLNDISEKLILLQHYSYGSFEYSKLKLMGSEKDLGDERLDIYWGWTKSIVSNYILDCAIKYRVIQDTIKNDDRYHELNKKASNFDKLGVITKGNFDLNLRESCNKIIHAINVIPLWNESGEGMEKFKYWNGIYRLKGGL